MKNSIFRLIVIGSILLITDIFLWTFLSVPRIIATVLLFIYYVFRFSNCDDRDYGKNNFIMAILYGLTLPTVSMLIPTFGLALAVWVVLNIAFLAFQEVLDALLLENIEKVKNELWSIDSYLSDRLVHETFIALLPLAVGFSALGIKSCSIEEQENMVKKTGVIVGTYSEVVYKNTQYTFIIKNDSLNYCDTLLGKKNMQLFFYKEGDSIRYSVYDEEIVRIEKIQ